VTLLVYQRFAQSVATLLGSSLCPQAEDQVYRTIVESMANLDVDIKVRWRKGTHLVKTNKDQHDKKT